MLSPPLPREIPLPDITVYPVRRLITMNPALPSAEAVAVRGDRILGVGSLDELTRWGDHRVDDTFRDRLHLDSSRPTAM